MPPSSAIASPSARKPCKRPVNFDELVLKALFERMDPATRTVAPQWRSLAASLGVCPVTLGRYIDRLKQDGRIVTVETGENRGDLPASGSASNHPDPVWLPNLRKRYFINESVDTGWAASVEPVFVKPRANPPKPRYKTTKAVLDAAADERMAGRLRFVMEDFLSRMDPETRMVAPLVHDMVARSNGVLNTLTYVRVIRVLKAAGLIASSRKREAANGRSKGYVFVVNAAAAADVDYRSLARDYRLKTVKGETAAERGGKARAALGERILAYLRERADAGTRLVKASQKTLADVFGYSTGSVSAAMRALVAEGRLVRATGPDCRGMGSDARVYRV